MSDGARSAFHGRRPTRGMAAVRWLCLAVVASSLAATAPSALAQAPQNLNPDGKGNFTFTPGVRIQPRYTYDASTANNDFFIARTRLKISGKAPEEATYGIEIKLDATGRYNTTTTAQVENAWVSFPVKPDLNIRAGFFDAAMSRNALTSDSKLLVMDRSLIKDALTAQGFADNTVGVLAHGRPSGGRYEYAVCLSDNLSFETPANQARGTMETARVALNLLDPAAPGGYGDYKSSYIGQGRRLTIAVNGGLMTGAHAGSDEYDVNVVGGDVFFNQNRIVLEAEYDEWREDVQGVAPGGKVDNHGAGGYVQGGFLVRPQWELAARYQQVDADNGAYANRVQWTTLGTNYYFRDHNLKIQAEYTIKDEDTGSIDNDIFQLQLQLDY